MEEKRTHLLDDLSLLEAIERCGELKIPVEEVAMLLADRPGAQTLSADLSTPGTEASNAYNRGVAEGDLKLAIDLEANIENPKAKDAYKSLSAERRRQAINRKLDELFGDS
jgi:hypothetical protein